MTIPRTTAKKLCTDAEYRLVNDSFAPQLAGLTEKGLAQRIRRARTARDKYRALAERQVREASGRTRPRGTRPAAGNKNTVIKQRLFDETLARYEKQAARFAQDGAAAKSATAKRTAVKRTAVKRTAVKRTAVKRTAAKGATDSGRKKAAAAGKRTAASSGKAGRAGAGAAKASRSAAASSAQAGTKRAARGGTAVKSAGKAEEGKAASGQAAKSAGRKTAAKATGKVASKTASKKQASRASASRAGSVRIPPLKQVIAAVTDVVAARKEEAKSAVPVPPARSPKAPAVTNDGAPPGRATAPAAGVNPKGPEFPRNPHERGRLGAAFKRQQARRDSR